MDKVHKVDQKMNRRCIFLSTLTKLDLKTHNERFSTLQEMLVYSFLPEMTQSNTIVHRQLRGKNTSNAD